MELYGFPSEIIVNIIYNLFLSATSTSDDARAGGIAGTSYKNTVITDCYSTGDISASGGDSADAGGIVGHCNIEPSNSNITTTIARCYASGNISAAGSASQKEAGGIAGSARVESTSSCFGNITACVVSGKVVGDAGRTNRIVGETDSDYSLDKNIARSDMYVNNSNTVSGSATDVNGEDKTSSDLALEATYTTPGWDFSTVWKMSGDSPFRPILKWQ
ncbi:MAG: hypothetical protein LBK13_07305 [Spirochaetales bacterium]|jgi:hypothetical protein|nr:hypothetical protein [Spirochaetales bacterium]